MKIPLNFFGKSSIEFIAFEKKSIKDSLRVLKDTHPKIKAIFMGTRCTDGEYLRNMKSFAPTDKDWPEFMRINPILDWTYSEIWFLIRLLKLPYCTLYVQGFTSIDTKLNTSKLFRIGEHSIKQYTVHVFCYKIIQNKD